MNTFTRAYLENVSQRLPSNFTVATYIHYIRHAMSHISSRYLRVSSFTHFLHFTAKEHITITNGTVFNGTSTPIKDKYASDEKELSDMMADYLEHKCHTTDTMSKKSRDEVDDPEKKRQKAIADANKIVSGKWAWKRLEWTVRVEGPCL